MNAPGNDGPLTVSDDGRDVEVALGAAPAGRLVFANGTAQLTLRADPSLDRMARARFEGSSPKASLEDETLTFRYPRVGRPFDWRRRRADVTVTTSIPWEIDIRSGAASVVADLRGVVLLGFRVGGGASSVEISLPPPVGAVPVTIGGGASHLRLLRPAEVPVRLLVKGGASKLAFDDESLGAVGGRVRLQSDGFTEAQDRYEVSIGGGASELTVGRL
ncbi:MAG: hypothetical protein U0V56_13310 [Actinomycetota bacterium]